MVEQSSDDENYDDSPLWERLERSDLLQRPHFVAEGWIEEVQRIINEGRKKNKKKPKELSPQEIVELEEIVAGYIKERVDWNGFLNKGERDALEVLKKWARKLRDALNDLDKVQGEKKEPPIWYLQLALAKQQGNQESNAANPFDQGRCELSSLKANLDTIVDMEIKSPAFDNPDGSRPVWSSPTESKARARLQVRLDQWWDKTATLSNARDYVKAEAFHEFLKDTFRRVLLPNAPGVDGAAIKRARQNGVALEEAERVRREELAWLGKELAQRTKR